MGASIAGRARGSLQVRTGFLSSYAMTDTITLSKSLSLLRNRWLQNSLQSHRFMHLDDPHDPWRWVWPCCNRTRVGTRSRYLHLFKTQSCIFHTGQPPHFTWATIRACSEGRLGQGQAMLNSRCAQNPPELLVWVGYVVIARLHHPTSIWENMKIPNDSLKDWKIFHGSENQQRNHWGITRLSALEVLTNSHM